MCSNECTSKQLRFNYARLMIEVNATKVVYECLPQDCRKCEKAGHFCEGEGLKYTRSMKGCLRTTVLKTPEVVVVS